jgi:hypothetical protein
MRPFEMEEAKTIIPNGLSIISGKRAPTARYLGSMMVFTRGATYENIKKYPKCNSNMSKKKHDNLKEFFLNI